MIVLNKYWIPSLLFSILEVVIGNNIILSDSCTISKSDDIITTDNSECSAGIFLPEYESYYIECKRNDNGNISCTKKDLPKINSENECNNESTGKLINIENEYVFCLGKFGFNYPYIKLRGSKEEYGKYGNYFVKHTFPSTKNVFSFESEALYYVVKYDKYGIAFDKNLNYTDHCADTSGIAITRKEDFCSSNSSGLYYTCKNGICKDIHTIENYEPVDQEEPEESNYCKVKTGANCSADTYYLVDETTMRKKNKGKGSLYYCENKNESCKKINMPGYYIVDRNNYYICESGNAKCKKETIYNINCEKNNIGKIIFNSRLSICIANSKSVPLTIENNGIYIMERNPDINAFNLPECQKAIIKINENEVKLYFNYNNNLRYTYADRETRKLLNKGIDTFPIKSDNVIKKIDEDNIYEFIYELKCNNGICENVNNKCD